MYGLRRLSRVEVMFMMHQGTLVDGNNTIDTLDMLTYQCLHKVIQHTLCCRYATAQGAQNQNSKCGLLSKNMHTILYTIVVYR